MYNWSTDENILKKNRKAHAIWKLEQMVNFGLNKKKLRVGELKKYWLKINIDHSRRKFLELIIYDKKRNSHKKTNKSA